jgi:hypothetical protein
MYGLATRSALPSRRAARAWCPDGAQSPYASVLALQRMAGNRATRSLLRQPAKTEEAPAPGPAPSSGGTTSGGASTSGNKVTKGRWDNELVIERPDGTRFHVFHRIRAQKLVNPEAPRAGLCHDDQRVYFRIAWCDGTRGRIDVGANPQGALKKALDTAVNQAQGGNLNNAINTLENLTVQPFVEAEIVDFGNWKITGDFKVDLNKNGFGTPTGSIKGDVAWGQVGVDINGKNVNVNLTVPLGKRKVEGKPCEPKALAVWREFDCYKEIPVQGTIPGLKGSIPLQDSLYFYFDWANDRLRSDAKSGTAKLNQINLDRLDSLLRRNFTVKAITGWTSPEGSRDPETAKKPKGKKRWEGNDELSRERAKTVRDLILGKYALAARAGDVLRDPVPPVGASEYPWFDKLVIDPDTPFTTEVWKRLKSVELEGSELDERVVGKFLAEHSEELARMTPEDRRFVQDTSKSTRQRAERMFENLRRVEVKLSKNEKFDTGPVPVKDTAYEREEECPQDVLEEAERKWGTRIPFTKAPPPLCG